MAVAADGDAGLPPGYWQACRLAEEGRYDEARRLYAELDAATAEDDPRLRALLRNDLAVLAALEGRLDDARRGWIAALEADAACLQARLNDALVGAELDYANARPDDFPTDLQYLPAPEPPWASQANDGPIRVAILSFLFNWPSTGGGNVHTVELAKFLGRAGYDVRHIYARFPDWRIGEVTGHLPYASHALEFGPAEWRLDEILARYRSAVDDFDPDCVVITDSWNIKPLLAQAVRDYPYFLRLQAQDCLCPLNNLRLLMDEGGMFRQCPLHQFATPDRCTQCVAERGHHSGSLHQAERALCGVGSAEYHQAMLRAFAEAEAVLVVNPLHEAMLSPYARQVRVVTAGMDPARFAKPDRGAAEPREPWAAGKSLLLFAGLVDEPMKGFAVLHEACRLLWSRAGRRDFVLAATADPRGPVDEFTQFVGWQSQDDLPRLVRMADIVVFPTIAQEALGRTAVEAMAAGRPVVASRIGGLPFTVADGATGLLCEPADPDDLARKIAILLDDPELRVRLGESGRRRFEEHYSWDVIIERHYRPLLKRRERGERVSPGPAAREVARPAVSASALTPTFFPPGRGRQDNRMIAAGAATAGSVESASPWRTVGGRRPGEDGAGPVSPWTPEFPEVDRDRLFGQVGRFFGLGRDDVEQQWRTYHALHEANGYERKLGERKTLCLEEAFVLFIALALARPRTIVEVGTQHGKSTRRILDMVAMLGLGCRVVCFDVVNCVQHFRPADEAELILGDLSGRFRRDVLEKHEPGLIYLDVHTHALLSEVIVETLACPSPCILSIHDCGRGLCNPVMRVSKEDPKVTSSTGVWERYALAAAVGVAGPLDPRLEEMETRTHRLRIFETRHGLGVLWPRSLGGLAEAGGLKGAGF
jgi:glycosyltransferase involved in cell wall biosynthesis